MNFANVRSAIKTKIAIAAVLAAALGAVAAPGVMAAAEAPGAGAGSPVGSPELAPGHGTTVTIALLPSGTEPADLEPVDGLAPGLWSPGLGRVAAQQVYLDISQGNRIFNSLYDQDLPPHAGWRLISKRAGSAPADIVPGLLGSTVPMVSAIGGPASRVAADEQGRIARTDACPSDGCVADVLVTSVGGVEALSGLVDTLTGDDLLIALERPPPTQHDLLTIGIAGREFDGNLTSDSTRLRGYVLSTDIAPTVLDRLGLAVPMEMSGEPIHSEGSRDTAVVTDLGARLARIGARRSPVIGDAVMAWLLAIAIAVGVTRGRAGRVCARLLALSVAYLPLMLLLGAALEPSRLVEQLLLGVGAPLLSAATLALLGGWRALAVACGLTIAACALDVIAGSPLTALSLLGPNPGLGVRFYGIGNELEAILAVLIVVGTGAAIAGWRPGLEPRRAAVVFLVVGFVCAFIFGAGRFGADVGAVIVFPAGAAVAAAVLTRQRKVLLLVIAAPVLALAGLALVDLLSGGNSHLTRSVLDAGGLHELGNVAERRLRLSGRSFVRAIHSPFLPIAGLILGAGLIYRRRILAWISSSIVLRAAFAGALAATVVGTLANDSGALLLELGIGYTAAFLGFAWAQASGRTGSGD